MINSHSRIPEAAVWGRIEDRLRRLCYHTVEDGRLRAALEGGLELRELGVPRQDSAWVRLPKLCTGFGPSVVEEGEVEQKELEQKEVTEHEEVTEREEVTEQEEVMEQEEVKLDKEGMEVVRELLEEMVEVVRGTLPRETPARRHQGEQPGPKVPGVEGSREVVRGEEGVQGEGELAAPSWLAGFSLKEVVEWLDSMERDEVMSLSNGAVLDLLSTHRPQVDKPFIEAVWRALEVHSSWHDRQLKERFRRYLVYSLTNRRGELEAAPDQQWLFLSLLKVGGDLHRQELNLPRQQEKLSRLLLSLGDLAAGERKCHKCGEEGEIPVCGCLAVFFCGEQCQQADLEHLWQCQKLEVEMKQGAMLLTSSAVRERNRANILSRHLKEESERRLEAEERRVEAQRMVVLLEARERRRLFLARKRRREAGSLHRSLTKSSAAAKRGLVMVNVGLSLGQEVYRVSDVSRGSLQVYEAQRVQAPREGQMEGGSGKPAAPTPATPATVSSSSAPASSPSHIASSPSERPRVKLQFSYHGRMVRKILVPEEWSMARAQHAFCRQMELQEASLQFKVFYTLEEVVSERSAGSYRGHPILVIDVGGPVELAQDYPVLACVEGQEVVREVMEEVMEEVMGALPRETSAKRHHGEELGPSSPKVSRMEEVSRELEGREEGVQGECELVTTGQSQYLLACTPGLAGCSMEEVEEELPLLDVTFDEEDKVEGQEAEQEKLQPEVEERRELEVCETTVEEESEWEEVQPPGVLFQHGGQSWHLLLQEGKSAAKVARDFANHRGVGQRCLEYRDGSGKVVAGRALRGQQYLEVTVRSPAPRPRVQGSGHTVRRYKRGDKYIFVNLGRKPLRAFSQLKPDHRRARVKMVVAALELLACGSITNPAVEERRKELLLLLAQVCNKNWGLFKHLLQTHRSVIRDIIKLSKEEACAFLHSARLSTSLTRRLTTMFINLLGFTIFPSEKERAEFEASVSATFTDAALETGQMSLYKSPKDKAPKLCSYARVRSIKDYMRLEVEEALDEEWEDEDNIRNLFGPKYRGLLRVMVCGDKGGSSTKIAIQLGGGREPLVIGMFQASDIHHNLQVFLGDWNVQLRDLRDNGLEIRRKDGSLVTLPLELLLGGDMAFVCEICGHSGSSAKYPSLYRYVTRQHLQTGHRNGEPHTATNPECQADFRTVEEMERDCLACQKASKNDPATMAKKAKYFNSIKGNLLIPILTIFHIVPAFLHISLMIGLALVKLAEMKCDVLDGKADESEMATVWERVEETCGEDSGGTDDSSSGGSAADLSELGDGEEDEGGEEDSEDGGELEGEGESQAGFEVPPMATNRREKELAEAALTEAEVLVELRTREVEQLAAALAGKLGLQDRIQLNLEAASLEGDEQFKKYGQVEKVAQDEHKNKSELTNFDFCCDFCVLTRFDRRIKKAECSQCSKVFHSVCHLWGPEVPTAPELRQVCLSCRPNPPQSYADLKPLFLPVLNSIRDKHTIAKVSLEKARGEEQVRRETLSKWVGKRRARLAELLDEMGVSKTQYHGGGYVGRHVEKILEHHEVLSEVLDDEPEFKRLFNNFCSPYLRLQRLMKASRWLSQEEVM